MKLRLSGENVNVAKKMPCPIDELDNLKEMCVEGKNVLQSEVEAALSIPELKRRYINPKYLEGTITGAEAVLDEMVEPASKRSPGLLK